MYKLKFPITLRFSEKECPSGPILCGHKSYRLFRIKDLVSWKDRVFLRNPGVSRSKFIKAVKECESDGVDLMIITGVSKSNIQYVKGDGLDTKIILNPRLSISYYTYQGLANISSDCRNYAEASIHKSGHSRLIRLNSLYE